MNINFNRTKFFIFIFVRRHLTFKVRMFHTYGKLFFAVPLMFDVFVDIVSVTPRVNTALLVDLTGSSQVN